MWHLIQNLLPLFPFLGMLWSPCCCGPGCSFFTDDFAVDDLATNYTSVSGSWSIGSGVLSIASSNAVLTGNTANPNSDSNTKISITVNIATSGDTARIILDYQNSSNYWFAEVKAGTGAYLRIYQRSGGTNTLMRDCGSFTRATGTFTFCASIYSGEMRTTVGSYTVKHSATFTQTGYGLGTGTLTGTVTFDDLAVTITSADCSPCTDVGGCVGGVDGNCNGCINGTTPGTMRVHFRAGTLSNQGCGTCTTLNGTDVDCPQFAGGTGINCSYRNTSVSLCGRTYVVEVTTAVSGSDTILTVSLFNTGSGNVFTWFQTYTGTTTVDCGFVSEPVPIGSDLGGDCNLGDSVEVSAV